MAQEGQRPEAKASLGIKSVLLRAVGLGQGQGTDMVRVARWIGGFIVLSGVVLALWGLILPAFRPPLNARLQIFWGALIAPAWTGVVIILLAELVERTRKSS